MTPAARRPQDLERGAFEPGCRDCAAPLIAEAIPESAPMDPRNVYAATKLHQEHLCAAFSRETGVPVTALRYHNVYGPRMPRDTPTRAWRRSSPARSRPAGRRRCSRTADSCATSCTSATWPAPTEVTGAFRLGDVRHVFASPELAATHLGFRAREGFEDGMAELARALRARPATRRSDLSPRGQRVRR